MTIENWKPAHGWEGLYEVSDLGRVRSLPRLGCSFGWNSCGMGAAWERVETLLVAHGGAHNDTICVVDRKRDKGESE